MNFSCFSGQKEGRRKGWQETHSLLLSTLVSLALSLSPPLALNSGEVPRRNTFREKREEEEEEEMVLLWSTEESRFVEFREMNRPGNDAGRKRQGC